MHVSMERSRPDFPTAVIFVECADLQQNLVLTPVELQSHFGDKLLEIRFVCPQKGTAVLKYFWRKSRKFVPCAGGVMLRSTWYTRYGTRGAKPYRNFGRKNLSSALFRDLPGIPGMILVLHTRYLVRVMSTRSPIYSILINF